MEIKKAFLQLSNGELQEYHVKISERVEDDIHAVYINGFTNNKLDSELGAGIEIEISNVESWMADYRYCEYWCRPAFGSNCKDIPDETQGMVYRKKDGIYGVIIPVVSEDYKCVITGSGEMRILAKLFSWNENLTVCKALAFMWTEGKNPYELFERCTSYGLKLLGTGCRTRKERRYPEIFEYLGWCSWDAFEIRVTEKNILDKCEEFKEKGIPVKWIILDDMWAEIHDYYDINYENREEMFRLMHSSKLYSFQADPIRFPNGLQECIAKVNKFGITVGIWHPTTGYWMGLDPEGIAFNEYKEYLVQTEDGRFIHSPKQEKAYLFYSKLHDYLRKCGIEFVKIDNQSMTRRFYKKMGTVGAISRQFHNAMEASVGQHFDNQMINCMGMANEDMWNRSVSSIARCSDDFQPENREWFTKHILQCSYNSLIQGQFYYCDWDMWWSDDGQAEKNSILRAVSGGPIYVSDTLGRTRKEIIKPLILEDGKILRCDRLAMPSEDCLTIDPTSSGKLFKLQNMCNGSGILAVFNLDLNNRIVKGTISPQDVDGIVGEEFAVYEHFTKEMRILKKNEYFELGLKNADEYKLYMIIPLVNGNGIIGRIDKFISPATFCYRKNGAVEFTEDGPYAYVKNRELLFG